MSVRYWPMQNPIAQLRREVDRLLSGFADAVPGGGVLAGVLRGQPAVNVWETDDALHVETEMAGVKTEQVDLSVVGDQLTIKIERPDTVQEGVTYHRRERPVGTLTRVIALPTEVDANQVEASLCDGVLRIDLPKAEAARPRKIPVHVGK